MHRAFSLFRYRQVVRVEAVGGERVQGGPRRDGRRGIRLVPHQGAGQDPQTADLGHRGPGELPLHHQDLLPRRPRRHPRLLHQPARLLREPR